MEESVTGKRKTRPANYDLCIICQSNTGEDVEKKYERGIKSLSNAASSREAFMDTDNADAIKRVQEIELSDEVVCHRKCFSNFTNKTLIQRLDKTAKGTSSGCSISIKQAPKDSTMSRTTRKVLPSVDWTLCIFCQENLLKHRLCSVTSFNVSNTILEFAPLDWKMRVRLAGVSDLIAAEAKYHNICLTSFKRTTSKTQLDAKKNDIAMVLLCNELKFASTKDQILQLSDVWNRYYDLVQETCSEIPPSFLSRRASFREKLQTELQAHYHFVQPKHRSVEERQTLLVPLTYSNVVLSEAFYSDQTSGVDEITMPVYKPEDNWFLSLVHVALKIRGDLLSTPGHQGFSVTEAYAFECVPDSLYMFLNLLFGGQDLLEPEEAVDSDPDSMYRQTQLLNCAQDIVYGVSGGKKWTPKHIGLGSTIHQMTRSKQLVQLLHKAGHIISYEDILEMDTALAQETLRTMDPQSGFIMPPNLSPGTFTHFTADNIDINDATLDGKNTFHGTQLAAWQRSPGIDLNTQNLKPSKNRTLNVPDIIDNLIPANIKEGISSPSFTKKVEFDVFNVAVNDCESAQTATATDLAFNIFRQGKEPKISWTHFNQIISKYEKEMTIVGYLPIIQEPAHELDTLNTVVRRCMYISQQLNEYYTVITVDQALYYKLMDLKWSVPEYSDRLIPRLGGLHIAMNFLKVIGDHMDCSGLADVWIEAGLLGPNSTEKVLEGKSYSRGIRAHKLTVQALWHLLIPQFLSVLREEDQDLYKEVYDIKDDLNTIEDLILKVKDDRFTRILTNFITQNENPNFLFWWNYMKMVSILLQFTRSQRDGIWELYLFSFRSMLPYFFRYDHTNYARWGSIYLADATQLPDSVLQEFKNGNFVVKRSKLKFNQVDPDQSQEWLNATGKKGGGIIGITRTQSALRRWSLSYNLRSHIAAETRNMYGLGLDESVTHNESSNSRRIKDNKDESSIISVLQRFQVFSTDQNENLQNPATKDVCTEAIQESLLNAEMLGQEKLNIFVAERILPLGNDEEDTVAKSIRDVIKQSKPSTFASLYDVTVEKKSAEKQMILKADRNILQRLVTAYEAGREVNLANILKHELMPVPLSLAEMNGNLRTGNKSILVDSLIENIVCPESVTIEEKSALIIDGQALVIALGRPSTAKTFGNFADIFVTAVLEKGQHYDRIDVVFDRYRDMSIKCGTRQRRRRKYTPIRRVIENRNVPLPANWQNFLSLANNKADLANFLSDELILQAPGDKLVVAAGGFIEEDLVKSNRDDINLDELKANHEEADTRIVLHAIHCHQESDSLTIVVAARDTDVLLLLLAHLSLIAVTLWFMAGTSKKRKFIPVNQVFNKLPDGSVDALLPFHAITGCDTTSFLCGHSKKTAFKIFTEHFKLLEGIGVGTLTQQKIQSAESFVCLIYKQSVDTLDAARVTMFAKSSSPESLPPTSNAFYSHLSRVHYQSMVWNLSCMPKPDLPKPEDSGWKIEAGNLVPVLMTVDSIPEGYLEMIKCNCTTGCSSFRCKCKKDTLPCTGLCNCDKNDNPCFNRRN